jgi:tight adherence protein B
LSHAGLDTKSAWSALSGEASSSASSTVESVGSMLAAGGDVAAGLRRCDAPQARWLAVAWQVSAGTGAPLTNVLEAYADSLRRHVETVRDRNAALAGPRATAKVLTAMPALGMGLGLLLGVDPVSALFAGSAGRACGIAGVACWVTGHLWSRALVRRAERGRAP